MREEEGAAWDGATRLTKTRDAWKTEARYSGRAAAAARTTARELGGAARRTSATARGTRDALGGARGG